MITGIGKVQGSGEAYTYSKLGRRSRSYKQYKDNKELDFVFDLKFSIGARRCKPNLTGAIVNSRVIYYVIYIFLLFIYNLNFCAKHFVVYRELN